MKRLLSLTAAALLVLGLAGVNANAHACPHTALVQSWYQRYLHRQPDPQGLHTWVSALRQGESPLAVQASILASDEYFCRYGHTNAGFVTGLYTDVLGRAPCAQELADWSHRVRRLGCRKRTAQEFCAATASAGLPPVLEVPAPHLHGHHHVVPPAVVPEFPRTAFRPVRPVYPPVGGPVRFNLSLERR